MTDLDLKEIPKRTEASIGWACRLFEEWRINHNPIVRDGKTDGQSLNLIDKRLEALNDSELNYSLSRFICEIRKENGKEYPPKTLRQLIALVQNHLGRVGRRVKLFADSIFRELQNTLDNVTREKSSRGIGLTTRQAQVITIQQEEKLWEMGILGTSNPETLVYTLLYLIGLNFAIRSSDEHRNLTVDQFSVGTDENGSYLKYTEKPIKKGQKDSNVQPKTVFAYGREEKDRCIVKIFQKYMSLRPTGADAPDGVYLRPLAKPLANQWYGIQPVGKHTLAGTVGRICEKAGFEGFYTNHSLRATCTSRMYQANVDEQVIAQTTGHRSKAIRNYRRLGLDQEEYSISHIIQGRPRNAARPIGSVEQVGTASTASTATSATSADGQQYY